LEVLPRRTAARGGPRSPAASGRGARAGPCSARECSVRVPAKSIALSWLRGDGVRTEDWQCPMSACRA